jgi:prepilin-type N-terminal cleavage/methylation domain-containing protein
MSSHYSHPRSRAFTLVELLVVMAAITLLAAITVPSIKGLLEGQKVRSASTMVKTHIESARARAMATGSPVAVMLERNPNQVNTVTALAIGQIFPPYTGDVTDARGVLTNSSGNDTFYDTITIDVTVATLLQANIYDTGDFIQIGNSPSVFSLGSPPLVQNGEATIEFRNPPTYISGNGNWPTQEPQLPIRTDENNNRLNNVVNFKLFRKPTKSFVQTTKLPLGTCVDLTVSGMKDTGTEFHADPGMADALIVFNAAGEVSWMNPKGSNMAASGLIHLLVGRTDQVFDSSPEIMAVENDADSSTFNANINDPANTWVTINPFTGSVYSSDLQTGAENSGDLAVRLTTARQFANNGISRSEN